MRRHLRADGDGHALHAVRGHVALARVQPRLDAQAEPGGGADERARAAQGGTFLMQDIHASSHVHKNIENPLGVFTYTVSCLHCMTVSLAAGGEGLGAAWGEEKALSLLAEAGFTKVDVKQLPHDIINNYYIARKD